MTLPLKKKELLKCASFARIIYRNDAVDILKASCEKDGIITYIDDVDIPFFVAIENNTLYIVFRGTYSLKNWLANINIRLLPVKMDQCPPYPLPSDVLGLVHSGFLQAYLSQRCIVLDAITKSIDYGAPVDKVFFIGHSLGGAIAQICMGTLNLTSQTYCITFGSPRVGNGTFARKINDQCKAENILRFVAQSDPVPRLPFLLGIYRHAGTLLYFDLSGNMHYNPSVWLRLWDHVRPFFGGCRRWGWGIDNHSMIDYEKMLLSWLR